MASAPRHDDRSALRSNLSGTSEAPKALCFACDRPIKNDDGYLVGCTDEQDVGVGRDCYRKISKAGEDGYQPPLGGPRLYTLDIAYRLRRAALSNSTGEA